MRQFSWPVIAAGVAATLVGFIAGKITASRRTYADNKANKKAFLLVIHCKFGSVEDRDKFAAAFGELAIYVAENEPETLAYEFSIDTEDPTKALIFERYTRKEALTDIHHKSPNFLALGEKIKAMDIKMERTRHTFYEADLGYC